jgi:hypothetical protein
VTRIGRLALKTLAALIFIEVAVNSLWIAGLISSMADRDPLTWILFLTRLVLTALELRAANLLLNEHEAGPVFSRHVLRASAALLTLERGFRLMPSNLDPTFNWWVVALYWVYALLAPWAVSSARSSR